MNPEQTARRADSLRAKLARVQKQLDEIPPSTGPSVLIAVPTHSGDLKHKTVLSLISTLDAFRANGFRYELEVIPGCPYVQLVRNVFANKAAFGADKSGQPYTHLLFIDADGGFSADDILALFEAGKPIAALPFSAKSINWEAVARAARAGVPPGALREYAGNAIISAESAFPVDTLSPVKRIGCGVMLIETHVFRALADANPAWRYKNDKFGWGVAKLDREHSFSFFQVGICPDTEMMCGEDYFFCNEARRLGFEVCVLPSARTIHTGSYDHVLNLSAIASLNSASGQPAKEAA
jgi:hypothetical protein